MKLPRWLVILMLTTSALAGLAAAGWWWITWPERTAHALVDLMTKNDLPTKEDLQWANQLMTNARWNWDDMGFVFIVDRSKDVSRRVYPVTQGSVLNLEMLKAEWSDLLAARRRFVYLMADGQPEVAQSKRLVFVVERDRVRCEFEQIK